MTDSLQKEAVAFLVDASGTQFPWHGSKIQNKLRKSSPADGAFASF
jgi:hypothetical protein